MLMAIFQKWNCKFYNVIFFCFLTFFEEKIYCGTLKTMKAEVKKTILILLLVAAPLFVMGQNDLPEPRAEGPPPPGLPIDFGISALIAAGLGLGIYHFRSKK